MVGPSGLAHWSQEGEPLTCTASFPAGDRAPLVVYLV